MKRRHLISRWSVISSLSHNFVMWWFLVIKSHFSGYQVPCEPANRFLLNVNRSRIHLGLLPHFLRHTATPSSSHFWRHSLSRFYCSAQAFALRLMGQQRWWWWCENTVLKIQEMICEINFLFGSERFKLLLNGIEQQQNTMRIEYKNKKSYRRGKSDCFHQLILITSRFRFSCEINDGSPTVAICVWLERMVPVDGKFINTYLDQSLFYLFFILLNSIQYHLYHSVSPPGSFQ